MSCSDAVANRDWKLSTIWGHQWRFSVCRKKWYRWRYSCHCHIWSQWALVVDIWNKPLLSWGWIIATNLLQSRLYFFFFFFLVSGNFTQWFVGRHEKLWRLVRKNPSVRQKLSATNKRLSLRLNTGKLTLSS